MPKPSPAKKNRTKKAAKIGARKPARKSKGPVIAKKTKRNRASNQKATVGLRSFTAVHKQDQKSHSKRVKSNRSASRPALRDAKRRGPKMTPLRTDSLKQFEAAVRLLYSHDFEKARLAFERIITTFAEDKEVVERSRIRLKLCQQRIAGKPRAPRTADEHYDWAIALMNEGKYEESIDHLNKALKSNPKCDYVIYALAITQCRTGNFERALASLQQAIGLKPENRFLAQRDTDFEVLKQDSRFVSLVFPDQPSVPIR